MERYSSYKHSGVQWLGEIPSHWDMLALKHILKLKKKLVGKQSYKYDLLSLTLQGIIKRDMDNPTGKFPSSFDTYQEVNAGDFVFCNFDNEETPRAVGLSEYRGMITGAYDVLSCKNSNLTNRFLIYYFLYIDDAKRFKPLYKGLRKTVPFDSFMSYKIPVPPISEQQAIADYLDEVTSKIDIAIAQQQKMIDLLNERKQIIINNAVTKGLNPNVKMKDSGVDWIGEIPEEWIFCKLKHLTSIISKGTTPSTIGRDIFETGEIRFLKAENIVDNKVQFSPEFYIDDITHGMMKRSNLQKDDILFVIAGATIGKVAIMPKEFIPANTNQAISFIRLIDKSYAPYIWNVLQSDLTKKYIWQNAVQSAQPNISMEDLGNIQIPLPSKAEQIDILNYIENCIKPIEDAISNAEKQIAFLQERKQIIINEVVTGKIKVTK